MRFIVFILGLLICTHFCIAQGSVNYFPFRPQQIQSVPQSVSSKFCIPFYESGLYGIADYEGNILLKPKFNKILPIDLAFPFFWATENWEYSLHGLDGEQVLNTKGEPIGEGSGQAVAFWANERNEAPILFLISAKHSIEIPTASKIIENYKREQPNTPVHHRKLFSDPCYFLHANTKGKVETYFYPDTEHFPKEHLGKNGFRHRFSPDSLIKMMTTTGLMTYLNHLGEQVIEPQYNCSAQSNSKFFLFNEAGHCALMDRRKNWKTEFRFHEILETNHPTIFKGIGIEKGTLGMREFLIFDEGTIWEVPMRATCEVIDSMHSILLEPTTENRTYSLWNHRKGEKICDLTSPKVYQLFNKSALDFQEKWPRTHCLGLDGDTLALPPVDSFYTVNDTLLWFKKGNDFGLLNKEFDEVFRTNGGYFEKVDGQFFIVQKEKLKGLVDLKGEEVLPCLYGDITVNVELNWIIVSDISKGHNDAKFGLFDLQGNALLPLVYDRLSITTAFYTEGIGLRLEKGEVQYLLNSDLEIVTERNFQNPICPLSRYKCMAQSAAAQSDCLNADLEGMHAGYTTLKGMNFCHIYESNGKYRASVEATDSRSFAQHIYVGTKK